MIEFKNRLTGTLMAVAPEREAEYLAEGHTRVDLPAAVPARQPAEEQTAEGGDECNDAEVLAVLPGAQRGQGGGGALCAHGVL